MNEGKFLDGVKRSKELLLQLSLLDSVDEHNIRICSDAKYSHEFKKAALKKSYGKTYIIGIENNDFDFLLCDHSFIQYSFNPVERTIRLAYYPNPNIIKTYEEFLFHQELTYKDAGDLFMDDYQQFLAEQSQYDVITPVRYDYNESLYSPLYHPASHLHIGLNNQIRISCDKILTPLSFSGLIISFFYQDTWKRMLENGNQKKMVMSHKNSCTQLLEVFFPEEAKKLFHLQ